MADYLQDLLDRFSAYSDPSQYPQTAFDPTLTDDENKKKALKKAVAVDPSQAGLLPDETGQSPIPGQLKDFWEHQKQLYATSPQAQGPSLIDLMKQNWQAAGQAQPYPPGQDPGVPPMLRQPPAQPPAPQPPSAASLAQTSYPPQPFPATAQPPVPALPPSSDDTNPETNPPGGAPQTGQPPEAGKIPLPRPRPQLEADGSPRPPPNQPGAGDDSARGQVPTTGADGRPLTMQADRAGMLSAGGGGIGDVASKILGGLGQHSNLLLAMGAGLMGAPNVWQGLGRGFSYAGPAAAQDLKQQQLIQGQAAARNVLLGAGATQQEADAAALDPDIRKTMLQNYILDKGYEMKKVQVTDSWGQKVDRWLVANKKDPRDAYYIDDPTHNIDGQLRGGAGGAPAGAGGQGAPAGAGGPAPAIGPAGSQFYAKGVTDQTFDRTKTGDDYLAQFSPEVQADIKNRIQGQAAGGFSRGKPEVIQHIQMAAEKYAADMGIPMDPATLGQRMQYAKALTSNSPTTAGGKARALHQGLDHFVEMADALEDLHLSGAPIEAAAKGVNWVKSLSSEQQAKIAHAQFVGQRLAGEMGTLTSASGGGVGERQHTADLISNSLMSRQKAAGSLQGVIDIMQGGIDALEGQRDGLFPPGVLEAPRGSAFMTDKEQKQLEHIREVMQRLQTGAPRPSAGGAAAAPAGSAGPAKLNWSVVQ